MRLTETEIRQVVRKVLSESNDLREKRIDVLVRAMSHLLKAAVMKVVRMKPETIESFIQEYSDGMVDYENYESQFEEVAEREISSMTQLAPALLSASLGEPVDPDDTGWPNSDTPGSSYTARDIVRGMMFSVIMDVAEDLDLQAGLSTDLEQAFIDKDFERNVRIQFIRNWLMAVNRD